MIPDIEVQLQVIIKSLKDNVMPAIDADNQLAQQQMQLSVAALEITLSHLPMAHSAIRKDIEIHIDIAERLKKVCGNDADKESLSGAIDKAKAEFNAPENGFVQLQQQARLLRDAIGQVIANNADSEQAGDIETIVLETSETTLSLGRAWNKPMGFEPNPADVVDLEKQLGFADN